MHMGIKGALKVLSCFFAGWNAKAVCCEFGDKFGTERATTALSYLVLSTIVFRFFDPFFLFRKGWVLKGWRWLSATSVKQPSYIHLSRAANFHPTPTVFRDKKFRSVLSIRGQWKPNVPVRKFPSMRRRFFGCGRAIRRKLQSRRSFCTFPIIFCGHPI